jgi:hypothetical protein
MRRRGMRRKVLQFEKNNCARQMKILVDTDFRASGTSSVEVIRRTISVGCERVLSASGVGASCFVEIVVGYWLASPPPSNNAMISL